MPEGNAAPSAALGTEDMSDLFRAPPGRSSMPAYELGWRSDDGSAKPYRMHMRAPSFVNIQCLPHMMRGGLIADAVAVISSVDPVLGDVDR